MRELLIVSFFLFFSSESFFLDWGHLLDLWHSLWHLEQVTVDPFSSFFTMSSRLSWKGWTLLSMSLPFNLYKSFMSLSTSCLSSSFSLSMRSSHDSTIIFSLHFSLQGLEQDSSIKSMQEVEASILEIGIAQEIVYSIFRESLVSLMLSNFNLSSSCSLLSNLNLHKKI